MLNISKQVLEDISNLFKNQHITYSSFRNKKVLKVLEKERCIEIMKGSPRIVSLLNKHNIFYFLNKNNTFKLNSKKELDKYIELIKKDEVLSRDIIAKYRQHSKVLDSKSYNGITLNTFNDITIKKNEKEYILSNTTGGATFIFYAEKITIPDDIIVVGIENPQVLWYINRYKHLFDDNKKYVFLLILDNTSYPLKWIKTIYNEYIHFGDFDLCGVLIYLSKIVPRLINKNQHTFLIPPDIESRIKTNGDRSIYDKQEKFKYNLIDREMNIQIKRLVQIIVKNQKGIEQESFSLFK